MKVINCLTLGEVCETLLDGEPVFIIRAKDKLANDVIAHYYTLAFHEDAATNVGRVASAMQRFKVWQEANPNKMKFPD